MQDVNIVSTIADLNGTSGCLSKFLENLYMQLKIMETPYVTFNGQDEMMYVPMEHHEYSDTGIVGNPILASIETAERIYDNMANKLADYIKEVGKLKTRIKEREFNNRT